MTQWTFHTSYLGFGFSSWSLPTTSPGVHAINQYSNQQHHNTVLENKIAIFTFLGLFTYHGISLDPLKQ